MKVQYKHFENGRKEDQNRCKVYLKPNQILEIKNKNVGPWRTELEFYEHPGIFFNSVMFEEVEGAL